MTELTSLNIALARKLLDEKKISAVELTKAHLKAAYESKLNAFIEITEEHALTAANLADKRIANGESMPLDGIPIAIKDNYAVKGTRTTAGSKMLESFVTYYESTVAQKLFNDGAVMIGKTNMDEFAMGSSTTTSYFGNTINPHRGVADKDLVPGGSSGGSAAAVSARMVMGATGTDTGGSIRQPAAFCGNVGIKPTYGRCSRWGIIAFASSLDQAGVFTRSVEDAGLMLNSICGYDEKDSTSMNIEVPDFTKIKSSIKGLKIGIPKEYRVDGMNEEIQHIWNRGIEWLKSEGAEVIDITLPHTKYALPTYYIIAPAEASSNLARYDGVRYGARYEGEGISLNDMYELTRANNFGKEVKRRIMIGTYVLSAGYFDAYYIKAQQVRRLIANDFDEAFKVVDAILTPTTPSSAFAIGQSQQDPITMYLNDIFTVPASLAGLPGISVPSGFTKSNLPLGLQVIGKSYDELTILSIANTLEKCANFKYI